MVMSESSSELDTCRGSTSIGVGVIIATGGCMGRGDTPGHFTRRGAARTVFHERSTTARPWLRASSSIRLVSVSEDVSAATSVGEADELEKALTWLESVAVCSLLAVAFSRKAPMSSCTVRNEATASCVLFDVSTVMAS